MHLCVSPDGSAEVGIGILNGSAEVELGFSLMKDSRFHPLQRSRSLIPAKLCHPAHVSGADGLTGR